MSFYKKPKIDKLVAAESGGGSGKVLNMYMYIHVHCLFNYT